MNKREYLAEHHRLVKVLKHPTAAKLKHEATEQQRDLDAARK